MTQNPIEILKQRLAAGEITISEYKVILEQLVGSNKLPAGVVSAKDAVLKGAVIAGKTSAKLFDTVFGSTSYKDPTDTEPLEITGDFLIYGNYFLYKKKSYLIEDVKSVGFMAYSQKINLIKMGEDSTLFVVMKDNQEIRLDGFSMLVRGGRNKRLASAYKILSSRTVENRFQRFDSSLVNNGYVETNGIRITRDGKIIQDGTQVDIRVSAQRDKLIIGSSWGLAPGGTGGSNPYEIIAGESGTSILSSRVKFEAIYDRDIVFYIIRKYAGIDE